MGLAYTFSSPILEMGIGDILSVDCATARSCLGEVREISRISAATISKKHTW